MTKFKSPRRSRKIVTRKSSKRSRKSSRKSVRKRSKRRSRKSVRKNLKKSKVYGGGNWFSGGGATDKSKINLRFHLNKYTPKLNTYTYDFDDDLAVELFKKN